MEMRIDFHAHVIPGADHGSDCVETSLRQLAAAADAGVSTVVATPHFYPRHDTLERFLARRDDCHEKLRSAAPTPVRLLLGAEVAVYEGMEQMEGLEKLCVAGSDVILLEMPWNGVWSELLLETVYEMESVRGLRPVMAHIDRYPPAEVERLLALGVAAQLNAESVCAFRTRRRCLDYVRRGAVWALGSDIHGVGSAYQRFQKALGLLGEEAERVMERSGLLLGESGQESAG